MKEAAGEANMTVITVILIAIILGVGGIIVSSLINKVSTKSSNAMDDNVDCSYVNGKWDC